MDRARRRRHAWEERHGTHAPAVPAAGTASNLPAVADDAEAARREVEGGSTREWAGQNGKLLYAPPSPPILIPVTLHYRDLPPARTDPDDLHDQ